MWNEQYYNNLKAGKKSNKNVREIKIYRLNLFSNTITLIPTQKVFFEKMLGIVKFNKCEAKNFLEKYYSQKYENDNSNDEFLIDFENLFSAMESNPAYKTMISVGLGNKIKNIEEQANLGLFLLLHSVRNHVFLNSMLELELEVSGSKLELFMHIKWALQDIKILKSIVSKYLKGEWVIYRFKKPLPLIDSPVINKNGLLMCTLSPYILLTINMGKSTGKVKYKKVIFNYFYKKIKKQLISNTYRDVIFTSQNQAEKWLLSDDWKKRIKLIKNKSKFSEMIKQKGDHEIWSVNNYSNRLK
jgi:hypothetical protein